MRAGAYLSSWGSWAAEKRKKGWTKAEAQSGAGSSEESRPPMTTVSELGRDDVHTTTTTLDAKDVERIREGHTHVEGQGGSYVR